MSLNFTLLVNDEVKRFNANSVDAALSSLRAINIPSDCPEDILRSIEADDLSVTELQISKSHTLPESDPNYGSLLDHIGNSNVVPFLGAGASLSAWNRTNPNASHAPSAAELASEIAIMGGLYSLPLSDRLNLARVASYYQLTWEYSQQNNSDDAQHHDPPPDADTPDATHSSTRPQGLAQILARRFSDCGEPGSIHNFLADRSDRFPVIVTTNYDNLLEKAFESRRTAFIKIVHIASDLENAASVYFDVHMERERGAFSGNSNKEKVPTSDLEERCNRARNDTGLPLPIIYKMHGSVEHNQFVITEEDYVRFLAGVNYQPPVFPQFLAKVLARTRFLFLGYSLEDWNFRVILESLKSFTRPKPSQSSASLPEKFRTIRNDQNQTNVHWSIQRNTTQIDTRIWSLRRVEVCNLDINKFVTRLKHAENLRRQQQPNRP